MALTECFPAHSPKRNGFQTDFRERHTRRGENETEIELRTLVPHTLGYFSRFCHVLEADFGADFASISSRIPSITLLTVVYRADFAEITGASNEGWGSH